VFSDSLALPHVVAAEMLQQHLRGAFEVKSSARMTLEKISRFLAGAK